MKDEKEKNVIQIAVVSYDSRWLRVVADYFAELDVFGDADYYGRAHQLLSSLKENAIPHVIIVDEQMHDMDLLAFMKEYAALRLQERPIVLGLCDKRYLGYTGNLIALGLTDFMAKPIRLANLAQRVLELYRERMGGRVQSHCEALYDAWGLERSDNTTYLTDAVKIASDTTEKLAVRKEIVWCVGEIHCCSKDAVDSALRRLIDRLEKISAPAYLAFKEELHLKKAKPSVGAVIYGMKDKIEQMEFAQQLQEEKKLITV